MKSAAVNSICCLNLLKLLMEYFHLFVVAEFLNKKQDSCTFGLKLDGCMSLPGKRCNSVLNICKIQFCECGFAFFVVQAAVWRNPDYL